MPSFDPFEAFGDVAEIAGRLDHADATVRRLAVKDLGETASTDAVPYLVAAIADEAAPVRRQAAQALGGFDGRAAAEALARGVTDGDRSVAVAAAESLAELKGPAAGAPLLPSR